MYTLYTNKVGSPLFVGTEGKSFPCDRSNGDYLIYLNWVKAGNKPTVRVSPYPDDMG